MMIISDVRGHEKGASEEDSGRGSDDSSVSSALTMAAATTMSEWRKSR